MGKHKWQALGIPYKLADVEPPDLATIEWACTVFRTAGLKAY